MELQSKVLETQAALIEATQKVSQAKISIMNRETEFKREVVQNLQETQIALAQTRQKIIAARDVVEKSNIRAPQDGIVANIDSDSRTSGSAIAAGRQILEVVPADEQLIVEGRLPIRNINDAKIGANVQITLSNSDTYKRDPLFGTLTYIGADSITDEKSGDTYFPIHVRIERDKAKRQPEVLISPGIRAELLITSADRLAISYLTQPIRDSFRRAFRED
jgi:HlyD family secretion protein